MITQLDILWAVSMSAMCFLVLGSILGWNLKELSLNNRSTKQ